MARFRRLLLPTNLSELAAHAAKFARPLAERFGATLHVLHACEPVLAPTPTPELMAGALPLVPDEARLEQELEDFIRATLGRVGVPVVPAVRTGLPARVITEYAHEQGVDLIVMGTHARGVIPRIFLGSVSKAVLETAGCAVLMVPAAAPVPEDEPCPDPAAIVAGGRAVGAI